MSIVDAFTGENREQERKRKLEAIAESMAKVGAFYALTSDELNEALSAFIQKKRLRNTEREISGMRSAKISK